MLTNDTIDLLLSRRSVRAYKPDSISEEEMNSLLTAARYAPSAMGKQERFFSVVTDPKLLEEIGQAGGNQPFYNAPAAVIVDNQQNGTEGSLTLQEPAPALSGNLQDVSSRVSVRNRDGLASLNSASIAIRGKVFLRITDSRGKVLASGNYDTGDNVRVTGIPPIKVEVTDSSRINISYMGGTLVVPAARQVSFTLPQR